MIRNDSLALRRAILMIDPEQSPVCMPRFVKTTVRDLLAPLPPNPATSLAQWRELAGVVDVATHQIECTVECGDKPERFQGDRAVLVAIVPSRG